jgi:hypothetical protein
MTGGRIEAAQRVEGQITNGCRHLRSVPPVGLTISALRDEYLSFVQRPRTGAFFAP